jgi:hypothetical protein
MKKRTVFLVISIGISFLISCLDAEKQGHFREIDAMMRKLDSLEIAFKALPNDSFTIIKKNAAEIEKEVKTYFSEDTVDHAFARKMNRIRGIRKDSDFINMRRIFLDTIFTFQREQLRMLKEDIAGGAGKRDAYASYVEAERENLAVIVSSFNDYYQRFNALRSDYYDVADEIRARILPFKEKAEKK